MIIVGMYIKRWLVKSDKFSKLQGVIITAMTATNISKWAAQKIPTITQLKEL